MSRRSSGRVQQCRSSQRSTRSLCLEDAPAAVQGGLSVRERNWEDKTARVRDGMGRVWAPDYKDEDVGEGIPGVGVAPEVRDAVFHVGHRLGREVKWPELSHVAEAEARGSGAALLPEGERVLRGGLLALDKVVVHLRRNATEAQQAGAPVAERWCGG